ncbi:Gamma-aminobutyrate:alpha-ketoglutarate aminotransferase [Klebsiella pneumoniae]|uniref:Gamma-aminobutyrate:alpha-ketoglutarate aminotransferase n=1 Tax=Klebsiella pneumoniae TaxID=573 RepID=A0A4P0YIU3_KLEPN|nr:Gamma-aminobutyrate:alpha-ketoglutarate aminotransferase [Klebsiella pneumoniae]
MQALRDLCDTHGILLIADEVQTGSPYRQLFAMQHYEVKPI